MTEDALESECLQFLMMMITDQKVNDGGRARSSGAMHAPQRSRGLTGEMYEYSSTEERRSGLGLGKDSQIGSLQF